MKDERNKRSLLKLCENSESVTIIKNGRNKRMQNIVNYDYNASFIIYTIIIRFIYSLQLYGFIIYKDFGWKQIFHAHSNI